MIKNPREQGNINKVKTLLSDSCESEVVSTATTIISLTIKTNTSFQAPLLQSRVRQLVTPIDDRASPIWTFQRIYGRPLRQLPQIPASNARLAGATSYIRTTWPSQGSWWILICCITSKSLGSSYSSRKSSPTRTGPKILRRTFLSNTLKAVASLFNSVHASAP